MFSAGLENPVLQFMHLFGPSIGIYKSWNMAHQSPSHNQLKYKWQNTYLAVMFPVHSLMEYRVSIQSDSALVSLSSHLMLCKVKAHISEANT